MRMDHHLHLAPYAHQHAHYLDDPHHADDASLDEYVNLDGGHEAGFHSVVDDEGLDERVGPFYPGRRTYR